MKIATFYIDAEIKAKKLYLKQVKMKFEIETLLTKCVGNKLNNPV